MQEGHSQLAAGTALRSIEPGVLKHNVLLDLHNKPDPNAGRTLPASSRDSIIPCSLSNRMNFQAYANAFHSPVNTVVSVGVPKTLDSAVWLCVAEALYEVRLVHRGVCSES